MGKASRLRRMTVQRRILLLLYDHHKDVDSYEAPEAVTQAGIAAEHDLRQNHVSRALAELTSDGMIFSRSSHIKGADRRKKVYFLTQSGLKEVQDSVRELSRELVMVRTPGGELRESTLEQAADIARGKLGYVPSYHVLLTKYFDGGEIDLGLLDRGDGGKDAMKLDRPFFGRRAELAAVLDAAQDPRRCFIVIFSMAGQGKTAFLTNVVSNLGDMPVSRVTLNEWYHTEDLLNEWADFLKLQGKRGLYNSLDSPRAPGLRDSLSLFLKGCRSVGPAAVVVDDFHKARDDVVELFKVLKTLIRPEDRTVFLIAGRTRPEFYGRKDVVVSGKVLEIELGGLDRDSSESILRAKGIEEGHFRAAFEMTQGHPLALELYNPPVSDQEQNPNIEFNAFLGEEVVRELRPVDMDVLGLAAVMSAPVHPRAFFFRPEITQEVLDHLAQRMILRIYSNGTCDIHELLRSYFLSRMTEFEKKNYLKVASDYYATRSSERDMLEHLRLLREAGDEEGLARALLENGEFLYSQGHSQVSNYVQLVDEDSLDGLDSVRFLVLRSDIAVGEGKLPAARVLLKKGLRHCDRMMRAPGEEREEAVRLVSRIYTRSAEISKLEGRLGDTVKEHKKSVKLNKEYKDRAGEGKALNNLAMAHRERGELEEALEALERAREIFRELGEDTAMALVEVNIGDIYLLKRDYRRSRKHFRTAQLTTTRYPPARALIFRKIGSANMRTGDHKDAAAALGKALDSYREAGDVVNQITCLGDLFRCACRMDEKGAAGKHLKSAEDLLEGYSEEYGDTAAIADMEMELVKNRLIYSTLWDRKGLRRQVSAYLDNCIRSGSPRLVMEHLDDITGELGDKEGVLAFYSELEKGLVKVNSKQPQIILAIRRASLLKELGREKEAAKLLKETLPLARHMGFTLAIKRIRELMK